MTHDTRHPTQKALDDSWQQVIANMIALAERAAFIHEFTSNEDDCTEENKRLRAAVDAMPLGTPPTSNALDKQVDGGHYKDLKIQPIEYIHANNIPFAEGCAIKYLTRWRAKGGIKDLEKAKHFIELLIELESRK